MAKRLTSGEREARDELLLAALGEASGYGEMWVEAHQVLGRLPQEHGMLRPEDRLTAVGAGRILSRLADAGECDVRGNGFTNEYRALDFRRAVPAVGELLVPKDTPAGPANARVAWADAVGSLRTVLGVERDGLDVAYGQQGWAGALVTSMEELGGTYERPDGKPVGKGGDDDAVAGGAGDQARERSQNHEEQG